MKLQYLSLSLLILIAAAQSPAAPAPAASLFDPARHMRVSEVREGVQPVEYMLGIPEGKSSSGGNGDRPQAKNEVQKKIHWSLDDCRIDLQALRRTSRAMTVNRMTGDGSAPKLMPLATPLMTSGI